ncbi:TPA: helical hairpin domain-containing protein, partial [Streptococcus suis]
LARYDYAKMNLTSAIKLERVEKDIKVTQKQLNQFINEYENQVRDLENLTRLINCPDYSDQKNKQKSLKL